MIETEWELICCIMTLASSAVVSQSMSKENMAKMNNLYVNVEFKLYMLQIYDSS